MLTVAVRPDFFRAKEVDRDAGRLEVCAALPPEAIDYCLRYPRLRTAKGGLDELTVGRVEALEPVRNSDPGNVNATTASRVGLVHKHPFEERIAGTWLASRAHSGLVLADDRPSIVDCYAAGSRDVAQKGSAGADRLREMRRVGPVVYPVVRDHPDVGVYYPGFTPLP
jgi:hypothetical protein